MFVLCCDEEQGREVRLITIGCVMYYAVFRMAAASRNQGDETTGNSNKRKRNELRERMLKQNEAKKAKE